MMSKLLFYLVMKPLSLLPLPVLYRVSDFLYLIFYRVAGFRKKVVWANLTNSFPDRTPEERRAIMKQFYRHLCDLMIESIKMFSISKEELLRRCKVRNPELLDRIFHQGKSVLVTAGHYNNWELAATACDMQTLHKTIGIYAPLSNPFFDRKLQESRGQYGMELVSKKNIGDFFHQNQHRLTAVLLATDQSPTFSRNVHWMQFLNQDTAVMLGTERYARQYNYPVVFGRIIKIKRGYYEFEFEMVAENPSSTADGEITEKHTRILEQEIIKAPQYWLWTHKRWKRKRQPEETGQITATGAASSPIKDNV